MRQLLCTSLNKNENEAPKSIDQWGWTNETIEGIKGDIGAGPADRVGMDPDGEHLDR